MADTYLLAMRCPVYWRRDSHLGFRTELENLAGDGKGKGARGRTLRLKVPMRPLGADCPVVVRKQGNACGANGGRSPTSGTIGQPETGGTDWSWRKAAAFTR
jgi:hypothetical protein